MRSDLSLKLPRPRSLAALLAAAALSAGCGSSTSRSPSEATTAVRPPPASLDARSLTLANFVCRAVRAGAPPALSATASGRQLAARAPAAGAAARRTAVSLARLAPRTARPASLAPLVADYRRLAALYSAAAANRHRSRSAVPPIVALEQQITATAGSLGARSCAPAPAAP